MKKILPFLFFLVSIPVVFAQDPTNELKVTGKVKKEKTFTLNDIRTRKILDLGDLNTSCSTKKKEDSKGVKAILIKELLDSVRFQYASPRELNQFYFRFEASDGYTLVYSFNEIYNTETGNHLYIVTEKDGKTMEQMDNRILILTTSDLKSGNRNMRNLARIVVCKAE
jgi:hypothetical protein